ncbi:DUF7059 domain-containing protein [Parenemella sanctibonifatiensis]|uniref:Transferase n=1 Tax=Parenemella sanctibonifatiensis TaxID=2016505 RepID=A0A255EM55_9ACTN|nr:methyltransferase [Parenemella sanctibonifatiensis]OYN92617.1 transferase [Parenemella sanctibonifatiensis]
MPDAAELAQQLRPDLEAADYRVDRLLERIGDAGQLGLGRNTTVAADRALTEHHALAGADDPLATLIRLWTLQQDLPAEQVRAALPDSFEAVTAAGLITGVPDPAGAGRVRAAVDVRPYASDAGDLGWIVSDLTPGLDHVAPDPAADYVLGVSPASTTLTQLTMPTPVDSALDLGTGCGVQALHLTQHANHVVATDLNRRALELAELTLALSGASAELRLGSLYEPVSERFDLIVTNPPYVMSPPDTAALTYREGGFEADGLVAQVISGSGAHLTEGGCLQVLGNWAQIDGQDWQDRVAAWLPAGADAWFLERESLDPYEYIEVWLTDAGLDRTPHWRHRYDAWLDYFAQQRITGVSMGWVLVVNSHREDPVRRYEAWPHQVHQPVGQAYAATRDSLWLARASETELWQLAPRPVEGVSQEAIGQPGADDPEAIVLRQRFGLGRAEIVDTATAAVVGACDGDLTLGVLVDAVGQVLDEPASGLRARLAPRLRELILLGFLQS